MSIKTEVEVSSSRYPIVRLLNRVSKIAAPAIRLSIERRPSLPELREFYSPKRVRKDMRANAEVNSI